jgi:hypothetical protein
MSTEARAGRTELAEAGGGGAAGAPAQQPPSYDIGVIL